MPSDQHCNALKSEIARIARKELKDELQSLRRATTGYRSEFAALKRDVKSLQSQLRANTQVFKAVLPAPADEAADRGRKIRFSAHAQAAHRVDPHAGQA